VTAPSRGRLLPDPKLDAIVAVFYCLQDPRAELDQPVSEHGYYTGIWMVESEKNKMARLGNMRGLKVDYFESELDLFNEIVDRVRLWDPDVLAGWEVHASSWGFLAGRASEEYSGCHRNLRTVLLYSRRTAFRSEPLGRVLESSIGTFSRRSFKLERDAELGFQGCGQTRFQYLANHAR